MYIVSAREVAFLPPDATDDYTKAMVVYVEPPINFDAIAIENYLRNTDVAAGSGLEDADMFNIKLLGSTNEVTTIYAANETGNVSDAMGKMKRKVAEFIGLMGAEVRID